MAIFSSKIAIFRVRRVEGVKNFLAPYCVHIENFVEKKQISSIYKYMKTLECLDMKKITFLKLVILSLHPSLQLTPSHQYIQYTTSIWIVLKGYRQFIVKYSFSEEFFTIFWKTLFMVTCFVKSWKNVWEACAGHVILGSK